MQFGEGVNKGCGCLDYTFCCNDAMECGLLAAAWVAFSGVGLDCDCRFFFPFLAQNPSLPFGMTLFHEFTWSCKG